MTVRRTVAITNRRGLHARASAKFVTLASTQPCEVQVEKDSSSVTGTSIMGLMMLGAAKGDSITISADGDGAEAAVEALVAVMLQITNYVIRFAPVAVFAAVASTLAERGPGVLRDLAYFMGSFYLGLVLLWALLRSSSSAASASSSSSSSSSSCTLLQALTYSSMATFDLSASSSNLLSVTSLLSTAAICSIFGLMTTKK